jgi:hypothetical protein
LIASSAPPSAVVGRPPSAAGIAATANFPATRDCELSERSENAYGQLRMNTAFPFWKAKRVSSSCQVSTSGGAMWLVVISSRMKASALIARGESTTT